MLVLASSPAAIPRARDEAGLVKVVSLTSVPCLHYSSVSAAWHLQYLRAGTSQCVLLLNPIATCLYRAASLRVKLLVSHSWNRYLA